jgi:hypothetical protein
MPAPSERRQVNQAGQRWRFELTGPLLAVNQPRRILPARFSFVRRLTSPTNRLRLFQNTGSFQFFESTTPDAPSVRQKRDPSRQVAAFKTLEAVNILLTFAGRKPRSIQCFPKQNAVNSSPWHIFTPFAARMGMPD